MSKIMQNEHGKPTSFLSYYPVNLPKNAKIVGKTKHINISFYFLQKIHKML